MVTESGVVSGKTCINFMNLKLRPNNERRALTNKIEAYIYCFHYTTFVYKLICIRFSVLKLK